MPSPSPLPVDPQDLWIQGLGPGVYVAGPDPWEAAEQGCRQPALHQDPPPPPPALDPSRHQGLFQQVGPSHLSRGSPRVPPPWPARSRAPWVQQSRRALPEGTARRCLQAPGLGARAGRLSPPPAPRGPAPRRWTLCARGPPGPRTGRCRSPSSGCGRASRYPTPRRSPSLTCLRKRRSPGGSPGRTRSVWRVDGGRGRPVTVRPGSPASGHTPGTPTGRSSPPGASPPPCA